jgi:hypothetical protein
LPGNFILYNQNNQIYWQLHASGIIIKLRFFTFLLLIFYANSGFAFGLGEIALKSHLGEKLFARVNVTDVDTQPESNCFTVTDESDVPAFKKANITLKPGNADYQLTITTNDVVTEPIVNLRVSFHCESNINREYVLLLDPAPTLDMEKASVAEITGFDSINVADKNTKLPATSVTKKPSAQQADLQDLALPLNKTDPGRTGLTKRTRKKNLTAATSVDEQLLEAYTGKQKTETTTPAKPVLEENLAVANTRQSTDKAYLVISGGSALNENANKPGLSLRLATTIDFSRPAIASPTATDTMDEVTVMSNRLAHLEKQITSLQERNTQLLADAAKAKMESESFNWQKVLLFTLLGAIITLAGAEWLRRRVFSRRPDNVTTQWFDAETSTDTATAASNEISSDFEDAHTNGPTFNAPFTEPLTQDTYLADKQMVAQPEIEEHFNVLEDADVFIEHDRPALAIQLLQNHLNDAPAESPVIWFKLLNLLAKDGSKTDYDAAVVECKKHFNIKAPEFGAISAPDNASIEDYPHIITRLEGVWGSQYAVGFLNDLIHNQRSQPREGLAQNAFNDLFFLRLIAKGLDKSNSSTQPPESLQLAVTEPTLESESFNDALFTDMGPLGEIDPSDEIDMPPNAAVASAEDVVGETVDFTSAQPDAMLAFDEPFQMMEEIDFDHASGTLETEQATELTPLQEAPTIKPETKPGTSPSSSPPQQPKVNEIEWDLPEIKPD